MNQTNLVHACTECKTPGSVLKLRFTSDGRLYAECICEACQQSYTTWWDLLESLYLTPPEELPEAA